jgi:(E)-4-hydroxy-3-methyl-but-2-enyl pyrophosphate reductase
MEVLTAHSAGFCRGVQRAVQRARELAAAGAPVYSDGPLIHNRQMMAELRRDGVIEAGDPSQLGGGTLIIRAHGIPPDRRHWLQSLPVCLADATCPDVARIQAQIRKHARQGSDIVIYGDDGHAEVVGLLGYAEGRGHVIGGPTDVAALPVLRHVCLVAQSTQFPAAYAEVAAAVRERFPDAVVLDTICASTCSRQRELEELARCCDAIVIVGGMHSANTLRLVALARGLRPTVHIETADELQPGDFRGVKCVCLTSGASTPPFILDAARQRLERFPG